MWKLNREEIDRMRDLVNYVTSKIIKKGDYSIRARAAKPKNSVEWRPLAGKVDMSDDEINKLRINGGIV